ncbi:MAG TPA: hypothetical protein VL334_15150 [Anaerolineae bacterium]|nr:hypothetical protein [Anaerolineae bacterium]
MIFTYLIAGLPVQTGDILCTTVGDESLLSGLVWRAFGAFVPGPIDHMALYVGPDGRCVESGPAGVVVYDASDRTWGAQRMARERAWLTDTLYGVAYPLAGRGLPPEDEANIRSAVAAYCLAQAAADRPYNFNFLNSRTEKSFYCTHLIYQAYLHNGIDLNSQRHFLGLEGPDGLILPQEIWEACEHRQVEIDTDSSAK